MDVVVREVLRAAAEVGECAAKKIKKFAVDVYETNDGVKKAVDESIKAYEKSKIKAKKAGADVKKAGGDLREYAAVSAKKIRKAAHSAGKCIDSAAGKVSAGIKRGREEAEVHAYYYKLGKIIYKQAIERDYEQYTAKIVDMIREIAKRSGDEQKLVGDDCCECTDCAHGEDCGCVDVPQEPEQTPDDEGNNQ